jgi:cytochrome c-type biogenesis protein CcmH/NrfG
MLLQATAVVAILLGSLPPQDTLPQLLRESADALAAGRTKDAIDFASRHTRANPRDPRGFLALGDAYMGWYPDGRFRALAHYRTAQRLTPRDPVPFYREAMVGLRVGGADGERLAADGLENVIERDPLFPDAWQSWLILFRNGGGRRAMIERLLPHASRPEVAARIARMYMEEERYPAADSILDRILAHDPRNVAWLALSAQSAFEAGDVDVGAAFYRRALVEGEHDSTEALWAQVVGIVTPEEYRDWPGVPPAARGAWLESFWARRNPNLFTGVNGRIAEHFARWRYARKHFPLLYPLTLYHRSNLGRTLGLEPSTGEREFHQRCELYEILPSSSGAFPSLATAASITERFRTGAGVLAHLTRDEKEAAARGRRSGKGPMPNLIREALQQDGPFAFAPTVFMPLGFDLNRMDSTAARIGYNLATGLSDRGVTHLRYGAPDRQLLGGNNTADPSCSTDELERWHYPELGWVRFVKPNAFSQGERVIPEMVFRPMSFEQFEAVKTALSTDETSEPAPLEFGVWTAQFRADDDRRTALAVVSTRGRVAATLVGSTGGVRGTMESDRGAVVLVDDPGGYALLAHVKDAERLGRLKRGVSLRAFGDGPALSDLLLARAWGPAGESLDRATMLARVQRDLRFTQGDTLRLYSEVYGLAREGSGSGYRARYSLLRTDDPESDVRRDTWTGAMIVEAVRPGWWAHDQYVVETLDLKPEWIARGTYLLRVTMVDGTSGRHSNTATIAFEVR